MLSQSEQGQKQIAILGSTGSIGVQALDVIRANPGLFQAETLTANFQADKLIEQALEFKPNAVVIADETQYIKVKEALLPHDIKVFAGKKALASIVETEGTDLVLNALVGYSGLEPTLNAIRAGKPIALANKEKFDLIAMGSKGRSGIVDAIMGSVAQRVSNNAKQAVLLIK